MDLIKFENVSFAYENNDAEIKNNVLNDYSITFPEGMITLIGQNGTGKSTFLLLAAGLLHPLKGNVYIFNKNSNILTDINERQKYVSFIYQNMEFETEETIGDLLNFVYDNGYYKEKKNDFIPDLIKELELEKILLKKTQEISKGELQRTIIAFSLLYGSKVIMMDEPIFALEEKQKIKVMDYLYNFAKSDKITIFYSLHDIDLSKKFSDYTLLFYKDKMPRFGKTDIILTRDNIEEAFEIPFSLLRTKERNFREALMYLQKTDKNL
ncbi:MAG: ABC transporter ATP-binding protein [Spirochaetes bacterium]|nr:ABC transporter ATP-binding protein [Spirochaetota bacterium]